MKWIIIGTSDRSEVMLTSHRAWGTKMNRYSLFGSDTIIFGVFEAPTFMAAKEIYNDFLFNKRSLLTLEHETSDQD